MKNPLIVFHNNKDVMDLLSEYKNFRNGIGLNEIRAVNARGHTWYYKYMEII